ncbi:anti-sigma factor [Gilvibacter sp.]|uniref:anti-sigma factor n=1 Tax=Gilvibacter sp. TaxID=2729997 RepID=UPI0025C3045C|nr:anti-sigma factor [Gilvibacter sp.]NQX78430.1 anti-sigma factor [Gilvibacter sp.]
MDTEKYIASGILELYVSGALSPAEHEQVHRLVQKYPELAAEANRIEAALMALAQARATTKAGAAPRVISRNNSRPKWLTYGGWAAATLATAGLISLFVERSELQLSVEQMEQKEIFLEAELESQKATNLLTVELLDALRAPDVQKIPLAGQGDYDQSFAAVYWNAEAKTVYLDVNGLPEAPSGMQYQLWSLTLDPLTPTSLGVLEQSEDDLNLYIIENEFTTEAYGITLEPEGGSESPTLENLYVLGAVNTTP